MRTHVILYILIVLLVNVPSHSQDSVDTRTTMTGMPGVMLDVVPMSPEMEERGITAFVVSAAVEQRLKEAGVPVLQPGTPETAPGLQTLVVEVIALVDPYSDRCTWAVRLDLSQAVRLERQPDATAVMASTWSIGGVGYQEKDWRKGLIDDVVAYTDRFIEAFAAANPDGVSP